LTRLLRRYSKLLAIAFAAMLVEGSAEVLEPWPLIFDYVLGSKTVPPRLAGLISDPSDRVAILDLASADHPFDPNLRQALANYEAEPR
jgi:hypothetical protein